MRRLLLLVLLFGCSKASDSTAGKQMPKLPPPPHAALPSAKILVEVDGREAPPIEAAHLPKPDFEDAEHRAWKLSTLLGEHPSFSITGDNEVVVQFRAEQGQEPALLLTRRGEWVALLIDPQNPFPPYHGQGRRLGRPGDPLPHVTPKKIGVTLAPKKS